MDEYRIKSIEHLSSLWQDIYSVSGKVDWSGMLPFYSDHIHFKDAVQEIHGKKPFIAMTRRLARRSKNLRFLIHKAGMEGDLAFVEWEMVISYKNFPESSVYGSSRIMLREGKIVDQRDYYDLWGDIFDNIPFFSKVYRAFMKWGFG
jgi:hypothetical protein